ncbi:MAG: UDP-N-acetylmuramoyl-L-alanine--D-glutamate ligase [Deltaproteobacteria bacterium]|nr:UDP-N-acetylmuramoyl-L-alanine--D-glutamate ligase [Deltaproteobacteria bacterium]
MTLLSSFVSTSQLKGARVLVVGLGKSGISAAELSAREGAVVTATDRRELGALADEARSLCEKGVTLEVGGHVEASFVSADLIVLSPGVPPIPEIAAAEKRGVPIVGELELAARFCRGRIVAITGTNGKSTVTTLLGRMLEAQGIATFSGGNLGAPLCLAVGTPAAEPGGALVVEVSSFQLERTARFRPEVALLLNVTEDHLDRYPSFAAYAAAKARVFLAQRSDDHAVVPAGDVVCESLARAGRARVATYGASGAAEVAVEGDEIVDRRAGARYPLSALQLRGAHNVTNAMASVLAARLMGAEPAAIGQVLSTFTGLPHRMQLVACREEVSYWDDSKATNVGAAVKALEGICGRAVLIAGGRDKGGDYGPLRDQVERKARAVVLIGEAADKMAEVLRGAAEVVRATDMRDAVRRARSLAMPGDAVLLAPACSSYDMFEDYVERGNVFRSVVLEEVA